MPQLYIFSDTLKDIRYKKYNKIPVLVNAVKNSCPIVVVFGDRT